MNKLFHPEGRLMTLLGLVGDHFLLSLLWLVCSLPIVTAGAAGAAMCLLSFRLQEGEECRLVRDFFAGVKQYFKPATKLFLAVLAVCLVFVVDSFFYGQAALVSSSLGTMFLGMLFMLGLIFAVCLIWLYPYMTLYNGGFLQTVKMAFLLGITNLGWSVSMLIADAALAVLSIFATFLLPFLPGLITLVNTALIRLALRKFRREPAAQPEAP